MPIRTLVTYDDGAHKLRYVPPYLTRDVYELHVGILIKEWPDVERLTALAEWCSRFTEHQEAADLLSEYAEVLPDIALHMVQSAGLDADLVEDTAALLDVSHGADEHDPKKDDPSCSCPRCKGLMEESEFCKFNGIGQRAFLLSQWSHLASNPSFLDAPYTLYQLSKLDASARSRGMAADRQKREEERGNTAEHKDAKKRRERYGHKW